jgi:hypothetical protein
MKSLKIVKGWSDAVNRRTDNTIAKKWKKVANKIEQHEHHLKGLDTKKVICSHIAYDIYFLAS